MTVKAGDMVRVEPLYLECVNNRSRKFWEIGWMNEKSWRTVNGRLGASGTRNNVKSFNSVREARREYDKIVASKLKKGYKACARPAGRPYHFAADGEFNLVTKVDKMSQMATVLTSEGQMKRLSVECLVVVMEHEESD